ncbi:Periplasmic alpha-amylase [Vibrio stylophorae]|uniref:Periplasmic alpha-amylase n=1 Tax=Vibrio stylophorae TaxID=659351 RepID=A0ABN8DUQ5_9VIBR|nr:alpha-amylase family glycosyl hydrolase [Vibrio stylophorae]CAH0534766.1 Periplasmic alpha-amylase [Vibrio stylophorae]
MKTRLIPLFVICSGLSACQLLSEHAQPTHLYSEHDTMPLMADPSGWFHVKPLALHQNFYLSGQTPFCPSENAEPLRVGQPITLQSCDKASMIAVTFDSQNPHRLKLESNNGQWQLQMEDERNVPHSDQLEFAEMQMVTIGESEAVTDQTAAIVEQPSNINQGCAIPSSGPVTVDVSGQFMDGTQVRDYYSGKIETVRNGKVTFTPETYSGGLLLLVAVNASQAVASETLQSTYTVHLDRFYNGDQENDFSYGRQNSAQNPNSFMGGDLAGLTQKLDYLAELGVTTIAIQAPFEQVHGWLPIKQQPFPTYPIDGKQVLDFTTLDANYGQAQDLRNLIALAHGLNMKVVFDVDLSHVGQATALDMAQYGFGALEHPTHNDPSLWTKQALAAFELNPDSAQWQHWWGPWIERIDSPELRLKQNPKVTLPEFFARKPDSKVTAIENAKLVDYLAQWLAYWPKEFGIDGMRLQANLTAEQTQQIQKATSQALQGWKSQYIFQSANTTPFELAINSAAIPAASIDPSCINQIDGYYQAGNQNKSAVEHFDSSQLNLSNIQERDQATWLLLTNRPISISYGSELNRQADQRADAFYPALSPMPWQKNNTQLQLHWQKLLQFRRQFPVLVTGDHQLVQASPYYAFVRENNKQKVMVVFAPR